MFGSEKKISEQEAAEQAQEYAGQVKEDTVADIVGKEDKIKSLFSKADSLKKYWGDVCDVFELIKDRIGGDYTDTPWATIAALTGALLYVFVPIDCIPDFIPIAGFLDDASVFGFVLLSASSDLSKYRTWKSEHEDVVAMVKDDSSSNETPPDDANLDGVVGDDSCDTFAENSSESEVVDDGGVI